MSVSSKSRSHEKVHPSVHAQLSRKSEPAMRGRHMVSDAASSIMSSYSQQTGTTLCQKGKVNLENTYRLNPEVAFSRKCPEVTRMMDSILESFLVDCDYEPNRCAKLAGDLSTLIKKRVAEVHLPRYRLVCNVMIGEDKGQGLQIASRCLWNQNTDSFASTSYRSGKLFAVASLYGIYFE